VTVAISRSVLENAGNIFRLYLAVKASSVISRDNRELQWELALKSLGADLSQKGQGLKKPRSFEPDLSLARELDLLERSGRWLVTIGPGKAFLKLWEKFEKRPPILLLLVQMLRHDRTFLLPFLDRSQGLGPRESGKVAGEIWVDLWKQHKREMALMEPPMPRVITDRTGVAYARGRLRLLFGTDGLGLNENQARRLVLEFLPYVKDDLPEDVYLRVAASIWATTPQEIANGSLPDQIHLAFDLLGPAAYVSSIGAFAIINELNLPAQGLSWNHFISYLRSHSEYSLHSGFKKDELLFTILPRMREPN